MLEKLRVLPGMKKNRRIYASTQYWVRKKDADLQIGFKHNTWYGMYQEQGSKNQPKRSILRSTVMENIDEIQKIQAQYLSAITNDSAESLIDEQEFVSPEGEE